MVHIDFTQAYDAGCASAHPGCGGVAAGQPVVMGACMRGPGPAPRNRRRDQPPGRDGADVVGMTGMPRRLSREAGHSLRGHQRGGQFCSGPRQQRGADRFGSIDVVLREAMGRVRAVLGTSAIGRLNGRDGYCGWGKGVCCSGRSW